jgi:hypothetical protein
VPFEKALELLSRDDRFKATIYAMNTLLIDKGIYTQAEFEQLFVKWASKNSKTPVDQISHASGVSA